MDIFDSCHYRINKLTLSVVGLWPYQSQNSTSKRLALALTTFGLISFCVPQIIYVYKFGNNIDDLLTSMPSCVGGILLVPTFFIFYCKLAEVQHILDDMREDWSALAMRREKKILEDYANYTRKYIRCYGLFVFPPVLVFNILPLSAPILDIISPLNVSRPRIFPHPAEYFVDQDKYFFPILFTQWVRYFTAIFLVYGPDAIYIALILHCCGMFALLRCYLEDRSMYEADLMENRSESDSVDYRHTVRCIRLYLKTKKFAQLIASVFTTILSMDIIIGIIMHSTASVVIVIYMNRPEYVVKFGGVLIAQSFRLFLQSWPGQKLMDHSVSVAEAVYNGPWYRTSTRTRRLLLFLMMNSQKPVTLAFAKLYVINFDSFGMVMKTSLSYCTVMASIHDASAV